ncbi:MAG TPA: ATP/GTP-binding protein, partial [Candidatus Methanomethylicus sp.]|nr:ATP/GTP-binding protein [Candidatus Methanomethylicus sp.]
MATNLLVIGPAGSGKTSLTARLSEWMAKSGTSSCLINLDPGAERLPYLPDYDVRSIVRVCDL